jgi:GT2 family glycosyltransferase
MAVALSHYASRSQRRLDLIERSLRAFQADNFYEAYLLADMSCQARVPAPEDLLLRAEIATRLGFDALGFDDLKEAFAIDPSMPSAQMRMLAALRLRGEASTADAMARAFLRVHPQSNVLTAAVAALQPRDGAEAIGWVQTNRSTIRINVFSAKPQPFSLGVRFGRHAERLLVRTAGNHPLKSALGAVASFEIAWPKGEWMVQFTSDPPIDWTGPPAFRPHHPMRPVPTRPPGSRPGPASPVSIVIPVYSGAEATRACLQSVLASRGVLPQRIMVVDDCGPDPSLRALLADYAAHPDIEIIVNPVNLGFIGSVNRALMQIPDGDVVLLNADTIVAPGWVERLSRAAYSRARIGTVTPLSNNGELTSVPVPFESTTLPPAETVAAIDATAAVLNQGKTVDLPSGVGFCLYITDACRRRTGLLNDVDYEEGYLEEVDYCLRASELGFDHVCACDVFVGHAGSQSFQGRKRGLVKHNMAQLERFFPASSARTHRFVTGDPLASIRAGLQRRLLADGLGASGPVTLVIGRNAVPAPDEAPLPCLSALAHGEPLLRLSFSPLPGALSAVLHLDEAMAPCRLPLALDSADPAAELLTVLKGFEVTRILYLDAHHPAWARQLPDSLGVEYDLHAVDDSVATAFARRDLEAAGPGVADEWPHFLRRARHFVTPSSTLATLFSDLGLRRPHVEKPEPVAGPVPAAPVAALPLPSERPPSVAVFVDEFDISAWQTVQHLARRLLTAQLDIRLVVFGATIDDDALRRTGRVTVTGVPAPELSGDTFRLHGCNATLALISPGAVEHGRLNVIGRGPKPILTWNPYLHDVLGCSEGECMTFQSGQAVEAWVQALAVVQRTVHGAR